MLFNYKLIEALSRLQRTMGIPRNILFSIIQALVSVFCIFLSYRILIKSEGLEALGLWSLLLAFAGMVRFLDISGSSSLGRFVPRARERKDGGNEIEVIHTLLISSVIFNLIIVAIFFGLAITFVFPKLNEAQRADAAVLIPWMVAILMLTPLSSGVCAAIDGLQRADIRSIVLAISSFTSLILAIVLIPNLGVVGFAVAQLSQLLLTLIMGWSVLVQKLDRFGYIPYKWRLQVFRSTLAFSLKLNAIGIAAIFFEPLCKILIGLSAGTAPLALFELAFRLIVQIRAVFLAGAAPLLPLFASITDPTSIQFRRLFLDSSRVMAWMAPLAAFISVFSTPIMSFVVLDQINRDVLAFNAILAWGWSINLSVVPAYLAAQAHGIIRWNFISHIILAFGVIGFWFLLPTALGEFSIVIGVAFGLMLGAACVFFGNTSILGQADLNKLVSRNYIMSVISVSVICVGAYLSSLHGIF